MHIAVTKPKLPYWVMHLSNKAIFEKLLTLKAETTGECDIVAYCAVGKPLHINQYRAKANRGLKDIQEGKYMTDDALRDEMKSWQ